MTLFCGVSLVVIRVRWSNRVLQWVGFCERGFVLVGNMYTKCGRVPWKVSEHAYIEKDGNFECLEDRGVGHKPHGPQQFGLGCFPSLVYGMDGISTLTLYHVSTKTHHGLVCFQHKASISDQPVSREPTHSVTLHVDCAEQTQIFVFLTHKTLSDQLVPSSNFE